MDILRVILLILHFVGLSMLLGGFLIQLKPIAQGKGKVLRPMIDGALTQLVTGLLLVATIQMGDLFELDNWKLLVKLVIATVIVLLVFLFRKKDPAPSWVLWLIGGLTLANVVIAVAWR
jgi:Na+-driven multidrug efflux pump